MERIRLTESNKRNFKNKLCFNTKTGEMYKFEEEEYDLIINDFDIMFYMPGRWYPVFRGSRYIGYQTSHRFVRMPDD